MVFKAGYKRLPNELINYIWSYDNRYKLLFKDCVYELSRYFHKNKFNELLQHETSLYSIYSNTIETRNANSSNIYGHNLILHQYILKKRKIFGHQQHRLSDNLRCYNLRSIITEKKTN